tara:strand:- start:8751 stop:9773 length:1023 start_codon:yes stop_codon:yes gene_type:complete
MNYIYFNNWWPGFYNNNDKNNIEFIKNLLLHTKINNFKITNNLDEANILIEVGKPKDNILKYKKWKYTFIYNAEPVFPIYENHDVVINAATKEIYKKYNKYIDNNIDTSSKGFIILDDEKIFMDKHKYREEKHLYLPIIVWYIINNNYLPKLESRTIINNISPNFCCFIVSNPKSPIRNKMFHMLNKYKKVNSAGSYCNNIGFKSPGNWGSEEHLKFISSHKFMICFENSLFDLSEKLVNAYLANVIPIFWSSDIVKNIFNPESMIFLEDTTDESYKKVINKIIDLDNDNQKYLEFINRPLLNEHNKKYWNNNLTLKALGKKINIILNKKNIVDELHIEA